MLILSIISLNRIKIGAVKRH